MTGRGKPHAPASAQPQAFEHRLVVRHRSQRQLKVPIPFPLSRARLAEATPTRSC